AANGADHVVRRHFTFTARIGGRGAEPASLADSLDGDLAAAIADEGDLAGEPGVVDRLLGADDHLVTTGGNDVNVRVGLQHILCDGEGGFGQVLAGGRDSQLDVGVLADHALEPFQTGTFERKLR